MSSKVLILAPDQDVHTQAVCGELDKLGSSVCVWSARQIPTESLLRFELSSSSCSSFIANDVDSFELDEFDSIWYRRPGIPKSPSMPALWLEKLSSWESGRALEGIFRSLSQCFWVNDPRAQQEALIKISQLKKAQEAGFVVPHSIVTNDPKLVQEFAERFSSKIIYKLIDESSWQYFPEQELPRGIPTLEFREGDIEHLEQVKLSLHLFQERIDKAYDLRVTVVGEHIFAVRIEPQEESAKLDWRLSHNNKLSNYTLPDEIAGKCRDLMNRLGLVYAAFDLCRDKQGRYVFFELNPAGQFLWLQEALELPIAATLAGVLVKR